MIKIIMGLQGHGKTKQIIELANSAAADEKNCAVCIERGTKLTYDISHKVRLVDISGYPITSYERLKAFICGLYSGNFDITHVYVDNLYRSLNKPMDADSSVCDEFLAWAARFAEVNNMNLTFTVSEDPANASEEMKKYL